MTAIVTDLDNVRPLYSIEVRCAAPDLQTLLVDWLNRLVFEMAIRKFLFSRFVVAIDDRFQLTAQAYGEPIDEGRHEPAAEIKGATFTELSVALDRERHARWHAQCVLDV
jgi:SHS2 domain-containing protein